MNGQINYRAGLDISEVVKNSEQVRKELANLVKAGRDIKPVTLDTKPISNYQQAQLGLQKSLADARVEVQRLIQVNQALRNELEAGKVSAQASRTEVERLKIAEQELKNAFAQGKIGLQEYNKQVQANKVAQGELNQKLTEAAIKDKAAATALKEHALEQKKIAEEARKAKKAAQEVAGSYNEAKRRLAELGAEIRSTNNGFKSQTPELRAKMKEYNELNDGLKKFDATMGNHQRNVGNYGGALRGAANDLASMATAYLSAGQALQFVFQSTLQFDKIKTPLSFILGSEGDADNKLAELRRLSDSLGLEYFAIAESYKSFAGAARASNFDLDKSEKIFRSVAKASAVLKLSSDQTSGALLALQQMISKGNVQAEELRGQLSERLPGAFSLAAKAMGVTEQELNKLLESGSVVASDMLPKLADQLDKAYGNKASNGIKGLNAELNGLKTALQSLAGEGSALSTNLFEPIIRGAKNAALELSQFFRGSFTENIRYALTFSNKSLAAQRGAYDLRDSNKNNQSALQAAQKKDVSLLSLGELRNTYSQVNETYKQAVRDYKAFEEGVKNGTLKESNDKTVKSFFKLAEGLHAERERVGEELKKIKGQQVIGNKEIADSALTAIADIKKRITQLQKLPGSADATSEIAKRIEALQARIKKGGGSTTAKAEETALNRQRTLQAEIDALTRKGVASKEAADQQEIISVEEKYRKLREKAIAFNNAKDSRGNKVNLSGLNAAEAEEKQEIRYKAEAKVLKNSLEEQAKYYAEFEDLKTKIGEDKAKARYASLIDVDSTYLESLEKQLEDLTNPGKAEGGAEDEAEANPFAMKLLNEQIAAAKLVQQKAYDDLLSGFMTYADKRKALESKYQADLQQLTANGDDATGRTEQYKRELAELDDTNAKKLDAFRTLFEGIDNLSDENARKVISNAEDMLNALMASGNVSQELAKELRTLLSNTKRDLAERMPERIINLANQIDRVAEAVSAVDEGFGKMLSTVGNVVGQVGNIKKGMLDLRDARGRGDALGQLTAGLGIFGAAFSAFKSVSNILGADLRANAEQQAYAREVQMNQMEAINKALERQIALLNEVYGTDRIKAYRDALAQAEADQAKFKDQLADRYLTTGDKKTDELIALFNSGGTLPGFSRDFMEKSFAVMGLKKLPKDIKELQRLLDSKQLDEQTAKLVENLLQSVEYSKQITNNLNAETIGSSLDSIADDFIGALTDGTHDFGKTFEDTIRTSILNGFKGRLIQQQLQGFYDQYAKLSSNDDVEGASQLTKQEIEALRKTYTDAAAKSRKELEDLEKLTGMELQNGGTGSNQNSLTGSIKNITEETGTVIAGAMNGVLVGVNTSNSLLVEANKVRFDAYSIAKRNLEYSVQIAANTLRTADNTESLKRLENMERALTSMDRKIGSGSAALAANGRI